jgi:hypothetical protein
MSESKSKAVLSVKLKGILDHTSSTVEVHDDGHVELEYYDFSPGANDNFGNDVAWIYRIHPLQKTRLRQLLGAKDDQSMLDAMVKKFGDVKNVRDWLAKNQIPFEEEFDSWA